MKTRREIAIEYMEDFMKTGTCETDKDLFYSEEEIKAAIKIVQNSNKLFNDFENDFLYILFGNEK